MVDLKGTNALNSNPLAPRLDPASSKKGEGPPQAEVKRADEAVRVDVDPRTEKLAEASPPSEQAPEKPAITEQAARLLALDVRQKLKDNNLSFAGKPAEAPQAEMEKFLTDD